MVLRTTLGADTPLGGAALAVAARLGQPRPRTEGRPAVDALRRQGPAQDRHSRRQPGRLLRRQDDVHASRGRCPPRTTRFRSAWRTSSASGPTSPSSRPAAWCRWRWRGAAARGDRHQRRGDRSAHDVAARRADADRVGEEDVARHRRRRRLRRYGVTAEIASVIADGAFYYLDAPVKRMGAMDVPIPFSPPLEDVTVPTEKAVVEVARSALQVELIAGDRQWQSKPTERWRWIGNSASISIASARERLARAQGPLMEKSEMGALLCFDMNNVRYLTATHIGTWAQDKINRFTLLPQDDEPILWDFGSAARHHQLHLPVARRALARRASRCCAARCRRRWAAPRTWPRRSRSSSRCAACTRSRSASTSSSRRSCSRCRRKASRSSTASSSCRTRA